MHHRWKCTEVFAPEQTQEVIEAAAPYIRLPFRIIVCVPESFEEALLTIPMLHVLKACRADAELTLLCPQEQAEFWRGQSYVTFVNTTENPKAMMQRMEEPEQYSHGPYDIIFMLSENAAVFRALQKLRPVMVSGFADNAAFRKVGLRRKDVTTPAEHCDAPRHRAKDYLHLLRAAHRLNTDSAAYTAVGSGNKSITGSVIAPFSTLSATDTWAEEKWAKLIKLLPAPVTLLALEQDKAAAAAMAERLQIPHTCCKPHEVAAHVGPKCRLYAVDGLLPQLAALAGTPCTVIMANRLADRYKPLGKGHRAVFDHKPDYPCYGKDCDKRTDATADISVEDVLE